MENYVVAIPSYQRADKQITLEYLTSLGIPKERIYIFVQTIKDAAAYARHESSATVIYTAADGVAKARNNILRYFGGAANILTMDDDVVGISRLRKDKLVPITTRDEFTMFINRCFATAARDSTIFGIYPVHNAFFMSPTVSTAVTVNTVIGFSRGFNRWFDESYKAKEDIELCARILQSGERVYRFNFLAVNAKHRTNVGGCHDIWASNENVLTVKRLCNAYPEILAPQTKKPQEVRVIKKDTEKFEIPTKGISNT